MRPIEAKFEQTNFDAFNSDDDPLLLLLFAFECVSVFSL